MKSQSMRIMRVVIAFLIVLSTSLITLCHSSEESPPSQSRHDVVLERVEDLKNVLRGGNPAIWDEKMEEAREKLKPENWGSFGDGNGDDGTRRIMRRRLGSKSKKKKNKGSSAGNKKNKKKKGSKKDSKENKSKDSKSSKSSKSSSSSSSSSSSEDGCPQCTVAPYYAATGVELELLLFQVYSFGVLYPFTVGPCHHGYLFGDPTAPISSQGICLDENTLSLSFYGSHFCNDSSSGFLREIVNKSLSGPGDVDTIEFDCSAPPVSDCGVRWQYDLGNPPNATECQNILANAPLDPFSADGSAFQMDFQLSGVCTPFPFLDVSLDASVGIQMHCDGDYMALTEKSIPNFVTGQDPCTDSNSVSSRSLILRCSPHDIFLGGVFNGRVTTCDCGVQAPPFPSQSLTYQVGCGQCSDLDERDCTNGANGGKAYESLQVEAGGKCVDHFSRITRFYCTGDGFVTQAFYEITDDSCANDAVAIVKTVENECDGESHVMSCASSDPSIQAPIFVSGSTVMADLYSDTSCGVKIGEFEVVMGTPFNVRTGFTEDWSCSISGVGGVQQVTMASGSNTETVDVGVCFVMASYFPASNVLNHNFNSEGVARSAVFKPCALV